MRLPRWSVAGRVGVYAALALLGATGCRRYSESRLNPSIGLNGGFEIAADGLPVNWLVYTPKIAGGDFDIVLDTLERHGGRQSLAFVVRSASSVGGWHSPGFTNEFPSRPGTVHDISFWARNDGATFRVLVGGVTAMRGTYETMVQSSASTNGWQRFAYRYTLPAGYDRLRLEVNVLGPGTFRIDDLAISGVTPR